MLRFFHAALFVVVIGAVSPKPALAARLKTVVRITSRADAELLGRIRGQISDLEVVLLVARTERLEPTLKAQLEVADRLAAARGARSVIWFDDQRKAVIVHSAETPEGQLLIRTVSGEAKRSALLEAVAIMVRTALRAQIGGEALGEDRRVVLAGLPGPHPSARFFNTRKKKVDKKVYKSWHPERAERQRERKWQGRWLVGVGWRIGVDGETSTGLHSAMLSLELNIGKIVAGLSAAVGVPSHLEDDLAELSVARQILAAHAGARIVLGHGFDLSGVVQLGAAFFRRSTTALDGSVTATEPSWNASFLLAPAVGVGWTWSKLRLALDAGIDYVPAAPDFVYEGRDDLPGFRLWVVQPRLSLGLQLIL